MEKNSDLNCTLMRMLWCMPYGFIVFFVIFAGLVFRYNAALMSMQKNAHTQCFSSNSRSNLLLHACFFVLTMEVKVGNRDLNEIRCS